MFTDKYGIKVKVDAKGAKKATKDIGALYNALLQTATTKGRFFRTTGIGSGSGRFQSFYQRMATAAAGGSAQFGPWEQTMPLRPRLTEMYSS